MSKTIKWLVIIFGILDIIILILFLLMIIFKDKIINLSFNKDISYISYALYDDNYILKLLDSNNRYGNSNESSYEVITISDEEENLNEEDILVNDTDDSNYKYIKTSINGYDAYLVVIYDASKIKLITSSSFNTGNSQETVLNMTKRLGAKIGINGGGFVDWGSGSDTPIGYIIKDSKIVWSDSSDNNAKANLIGFNNNNELTLVNASGNEALEMGIRDALEFGPFLIVNGNPIDMSNDKTGGYSGASRVAIAQRQDGIVLFLVVDGMHGAGPTLSDMQQFLLKYGAYNAANLDGGASSQLVINSELINKPLNIYGQLIYGGRRVVSGFGFFE